MSLFAADEIPTAASPSTPGGQSTPPPDNQPLAARLRPRTWEEFAGQPHLTEPDAPLRRMIEADRVPSCIFFGPPGTGKTTLARLVSTLTSAHFEPFSAITGGVADVRRVVKEARERHATNKRTILFVDEIHRFNRSQQDAFLPHVEDGTLVLIGATTENPLATLNTPLLSRCRLFRFQPLDNSEIEKLMQRAVQDERGLGEYSLQAEDGVLAWIARQADGDARTALGALEVAADLATDGVLSLDAAQAAIERRALDYDKTGDRHYGVISAYIKSLRGGDPDAALYWMAVMLEGGEDPMFIARRLVIQSSEDIGNADPQALVVAVAAMNAVEKIGLPEAAIPLAQATVYLATAPKSNASYVALHRAQKAVKDGPRAAVPMHLRAASLPGARERLSEGNDYLYPHDFEGHFVQQEYLPPEVKTEPFYTPDNQGREARIAERLREWWG